MSGSEFDYIVVGAGSAGCVVAARLSENPANSVLVIERGGSDRSIYIRMPTALSIPMNMEAYTWGYVTEPEPFLGNRRLSCPRGKVLGGSSSINGMVYVRGNPLDFEGWAEEGARGWGYADCLPYFKRSETYAGGASDYRGGDGPLRTMTGDSANPLYDAFVEAAEQAGYAKTEDYNGFRQEGFGRMDRTTFQGMRCSAADAYLKPALRRPNVHLMLNAHVSRILFDGREATGVEIRQRGAVTRIAARKEVILCAGSINDPQLLLLSGVGDGEHLRAMGIGTVHHLPGVGQSLQDHLEIRVQQRCTQPITLNKHLGALSRFLIGLRWILTRRGLGASNHFESCGFIRTDAGIQYPNVEFHFIPCLMSYDGNSYSREHGFQAYVGPFRSNSRGWVRLRSSDPEAMPRIQFNYMSLEEDWVQTRACLRLTREIFAQPAFDAYRGEEVSPGTHVQTDDEIDEYIRSTIQPAYHPCGTCKMGDANDPGAVVDGDGAVHGLGRLRVIDASIMPSIVTGNLNATTIMIGEKLSDAVMGRAPLAPVSAPYFVHPEWRTRQR